VSTLVWAPTGRFEERIVLGEPPEWMKEMIRQMLEKK
jgi:hypothetical protein